jgi:hypothetical protein
MAFTQNLNWLKKYHDIPWLQNPKKNSTAVFSLFSNFSMAKSWNAMAMASSTGPGAAAPLQETGGSKKELAHAARMPGTTSGVPSWIDKEVAATWCRYGTLWLCQYSY